MSIRAPATPRTIETMSTRRIASMLLLAWLVVAGAAEGQVKDYRWVDDEGNVHYAARRDQVPERYRSQLGAPKTGEPGRPRLAPRAPGRGGAPNGCILRLRGSERERGASHAYETCDACRTALQALGAEDARRAECFASSIEDELGKGRR